MRLQKALDNARRENNRLKEAAAERFYGASA